MITDKYGNEFKVGAVVKIYHYTGKYRRKFYMYKLAVEVNSDMVWFSHIVGLKLGKEVKANFRLTKEECKSTQIVEAYYKDLRVLKKK